jgi:hypothetical protein
MPSIAFVIAGAYLAVFVLALLWNAATHLVEGVAALLRAQQVPDEVVPIPGLLVAGAAAGTTAAGRLIRRADCAASRART